MKYLDPLYDIDFLYKLSIEKQREIYARITSLTWDEKPIEFIQGKVTGGSINVDGSSAIRRTCNLTLIAKDINIKNIDWGLNTKFKLEIGLRNNINKNYPDIIWFKQGLFIITTFNTSISTNNYQISISGKDKMCLLNGDISGTLPHTTDFGIEEYYNSQTNTTTYTSIPIKRIIREAIQNFGNELAKNIIINDIEDSGLELLEYRGDTPIYMFREYDSDVFTNITLNGNQPCYLIDDLNNKITISNPNIIYDNLVDLNNNNVSQASIIQLSNVEGSIRYKIAKFEYGSIPGYRLTDLVYAGDLIGDIGTSITAILDKIKEMLGNFEYFYDVDGHFIFQKKKNYIETSWGNSKEQGDKILANASINSSLTFNFTGDLLISAISNTPNISNIRNDYSVWGIKKTTSGSELDIHMRYAIDKKPTIYTSLIDGITYTSDKWDWRELIYRMALDYRKYYHNDDFLYNLSKANPQYPDGYTGYEQYYTDLEGFWRNLYNPEPIIKYKSIDYNLIEDNSNLYIQYAYRPATIEELKSLKYKDMYVLNKNGQITTFIKGACQLVPGNTYFYLDTEGNISSTSNEIILNNINIEELYLKNTEDFYISNGEFFVKTETDASEIFQVFKYNLETNDTSNIDDYIKFIDLCFYEAIENKLTIYIKEKVNNNAYLLFENIDNNIKLLYHNNGLYNQYIKVYINTDNYGNQIENGEILTEKIYYFNGYYDYYNDPEKGNYWIKMIDENPENLLFWFDFLDADGSEISKYAVNNIGDRSKSIKDTNIKSIYYREIPTTIFQSGEEIYEHKTGYTYVQTQNTMENLFTVSSKGISAKERIEEFLYDYACCTMNITITSLPVYYLTPNSRIKIRNDKNNIDGEYIVNKFTIPLKYNETMSITATKVIQDIT